MKGKIVFINPPYERIAPGYDFLKHVTNRSPSLGLLHLAAMAREHGWDPAIVESDIEGFDRIGRVQLYAYGRPWDAVLGPDTGGETYSLRFDPEDGRLVISGQDGSELGFDLNALVGRLGESGANQAVEDFHLEDANEALRVRLIFQNLSGTLDDSRIRVQAGGIFVLIDRSAE